MSSNEINGTKVFKIINENVEHLGETIKLNNEEWRKHVVHNLETKRKQKEKRKLEDAERKHKIQRRQYLYEKYVKGPGNYLERVEKWTGDPDSCPKIQCPVDKNSKMTEMQMLLLRINNMMDMCHGFSVEWKKQKQIYEAWEEKVKNKIKHKSIPEEEVLNADLDGRMGKSGDDVICGQNILPHADDVWARQKEVAEQNRLCVEEKILPRDEQRRQGTSAKKASQKTSEIPEHVLRTQQQNCAFLENETAHFSNAKTKTFECFAKPRSSRIFSTVSPYGSPRGSQETQPRRMDRRGVVKIQPLTKSQENYFEESNFARQMATKKFECFAKPEMFECVAKPRMYVDHSPRMPPPRMDRRGGVKRQPLTKYEENYFEESDFARQMATKKFECFAKPEMFECVAKPRMYVDPSPRMPPPRMDRRGGVKRQPLTKYEENYFEESDFARQMATKKFDCSAKPYIYRVLHDMNIRVPTFRMTGRGGPLTHSQKKYLEVFQPLN